MFLVDAKDHERFPEAKAELDALVSGISTPNALAMLTLSSSLWKNSLRHRSLSSETRLTVRQVHCANPLTMLTSARPRRHLRRTPPLRPWSLPNNRQRQSAARRHPPNRSLHVLRCAATRLRRRNPLAQPIRVGGSSNRPNERTLHR